MEQDASTASMMERAAGDYRTLAKENHPDVGGSEEIMEKELANGRSCVLQLTSTNEAQANRAISKNAEEGGDLDDLDLTPSETLKQLLEKSFPTTLYEEYADENGNIRSRPVLDGDGNEVQDKNAVRMRDALIEELGQMKVPDGPLEMLFDAFGADQVAEVTGRSRRVVQKRDAHGNMGRRNAAHPCGSAQGVETALAELRALQPFPQQGGKAGGQARICESEKPLPPRQGKRPGLCASGGQHHRQHRPACQRRIPQQRHAINLDGGGSSQGRTPVQRFQSERPVPCWLCIWLKYDKKEEPEMLLKAAKRTQTYTAQGTPEANRYIGAGDSCEFSQELVKVKYPITGGTREAYVRLADLGNFTRA